MLVRSASQGISASLFRLRQCPPHWNSDYCCLQAWLTRSCLGWRPSSSSWTFPGLLKSLHVPLAATQADIHCQCATNRHGLEGDLSCLEILGIALGCSRLTAFPPSFVSLPSQAPFSFCLFIGCFFPTVNSCHHYTLVAAWVVVRLAPVCGISYLRWDFAEGGSRSPLFPRTHLPVSLLFVKLSNSIDTPFNLGVEGDRPLSP